MPGLDYTDKTSNENIMYAIHPDHLVEIKIEFILSVDTSGYCYIFCGIAVSTARCTIVQSAVLRLHVVCQSVCLSVTLVDCDHVGWKSWKLIVRTISPTPSLFVAQRSSTYIYSQGNMGKEILGETRREKETLLSLTLVRLCELKGHERHLYYRVHCAVFFAKAQLSCS